MLGLPTIGVDTIREVLDAGPQDGFKNFKEEQPALYSFLDAVCQKNKKNDDMAIMVMLYRMFKVEYEIRELRYLCDRAERKK